MEVVTFKEVHEELERESALLEKDHDVFNYNCLG